MTLPTTHYTTLIRPNILSLKPYRCARDDYAQGILLDANENSHGSCVTNTGHSSKSLTANGIDLHRYPDPHHTALRDKYASFRSLPSKEYVMIGNGSDELLDLLVRVTCRPGVDSILVCPPTYGMYGVLAAVNSVDMVEVPLLTGERDKTDMWQLDVAGIVNAVDASQGKIKLAFVTSPGNPTGMAITRETILELHGRLAGRSFLVIDEAYTDFVEESRIATHGTISRLIPSLPYAVAVQTMSKSFGLAGIRVGILLGAPELVNILMATKMPYNVNSLSLAVADEAFSEVGLKQWRRNIKSLAEQKACLVEAFCGKQLKGVDGVLPGLDANFIMVRCVSNEFAKRMYTNMANCGVVIRFRGNERGCEGCLRISIGTQEENDVLIQTWKDLNQYE